MVKTSAQFTYDHVRKRSQMLFFELEADGRIIEANTYAESVIDIPLAKHNFKDLIVDFIGSFSLSLLIQEPSQDHLLNIKMRSGLPQSYYFHFEPMETRVLAFGRLDNEELEKMRKNILSLNQDLNDLTRQLHKKNARLQQLNKEKNQIPR